MGAASTSSSNVRVRVATAADIPSIIPIVNAAFDVEEFLKGPRTDEERMARLMKEGEFLVAEYSSGEIAASAYIEITGDSGYFGMLAVDPARQGRGLGRLMIEAAETYCRNRECRVIEIVVLSLRLELLPLYRKFGYIETRREEFKPSRPLKDGLECEAIRMEKQLKTLFS